VVIDLARRAARRVRRLFVDVEVSPGEDPSVLILQGVKLYREIHIDGIVFRGTADTPGRTIHYVFDVLPEGALAGKTVLDLGTAGGAVCFEAVRRGASGATGVETEERRIRGARFIKRRTGQDRVTFVQQDFWEFFQQSRPQVDVIFALNVLHHFGNPLPLLRQIVHAARERIVVEVPTSISVEDYNEYGAAFANLPREGTINSADEITRFLALYDFSLERERASPPETQFYGSQQAPRALYVYTRLPRTHVKNEAERRVEVEPYRDARTLSWERARADQYNIDVLPGESLDQILEKALGPAWASTNILLCGPPASGKSHLYESAPAGSHPPYNYKIFKFPNDKGQQGRHHHLNPRPGEAGKIAQVMLSTVDDAAAHCTVDDLALATTGKAVVCLVLNIDFEEHFNRLHRRQVDRVETPDASADYEVPLQFDCAKVIETLRAHGCQYRVLTVVRGRVNGS
jgi:2-polyprenyl-3-methyl-5-hydroxy-6-metoxy-1,4-benzoquinol methylase